MVFEEWKDMVHVWHLYYAMLGAGREAMTRIGEFVIPGLEVTIDLEAQQLRAPGVPATAFTVDGFARRCLLDGVDELGVLLRHLPDIERHENAHGDAP